MAPPQHNPAHSGADSPPNSTSPQVESVPASALDLRHPELEMMMRGLLHELRNPLSSILTAATLLQDSTLPETLEVGEEGQMLLDVIKKESLRLNRILTQFAEYIKLPEPEPSEFDLAEAMQAAIRESQQAGVLLAGIEIENQLTAPCRVRADEIQVRNALRHLLNNAAEAMPDGGCLSIVAASTESASDVGVCVGDTGKGFAREGRERAFQPFYSTKTHSLGLGLAMVRSIVEAASGRVWIEDVPPASTPGEDELTRICFVLPRAS